MGGFDVAKDACLRQEQPRIWLPICSRAASMTAEEPNDSQVASHRGGSPLTAYRVKPVWWITAAMRWRMMRCFERADRTTRFFENVFRIH